MRKKLMLLGLLVLVISCEDVIEVDVPTEEPRLIIDALIRIDVNQELSQPTIKVSLTGSFFGTTPVTGLTDITITNLDFDNAGGGNAIILEEVEPNSGIYRDPDPVGTDFLTDGRLILQLTHEDRIYFARTEFVPTVPIDNLEQGDETLFDDEDTELKVTITDDAQSDDFYILDFQSGEFLALEDEFFNGQTFEFSYFLERDLVAGEELTVSILGADQTFFNYVDLLVEQTQDDGGVFETPVATARGNIFDVTDLDNTEVFDNVNQPDVFPLGYFAVVQEYQSTIIIE